MEKSIEKRKQTLQKRNSDVQFPAAALHRVFCPGCAADLRRHAGIQPCRFLSAAKRAGKSQRLRPGVQLADAKRDVGRREAADFHGDLHEVPVPIPPGAEGLRAHRLGDFSPVVVIEGDVLHTADRVFLLLRRRLHLLAIFRFDGRPRRPHAEVPDLGRILRVRLACGVNHPVLELRGSTVMSDTDTQPGFAPLTTSSVLMCGPRSGRAPRAHEQQHAAHDPLEQSADPAFVTLPRPLRTGRRQTSCPPNVFPAENKILPPLQHAGCRCGVSLTGGGGAASARQDSALSYNVPRAAQFTIRE